MARPTRMFVPLDIGYFDDERIVDVGEKAAWMYLQMLTTAKRLDTDGVLTRGQIGKLGVTGWAARLRDLIACDLVVELPMRRDAYAISSWHRWNESKDHRAERLAADRGRKAAKRGQEEQVDHDV